MGFVLALLSFLFVSSVADTAASGSPEAPHIRIAEQFGIAYAPVTAARQRRLIEDALPGYSVTWVRLGNAATIREAMLAGRLDVGFMGIPPFLIGLDNGMEWRIFSGLAVAPLGLVTTVPSVDELGSLRGAYRIAVPQPGSIQHILLAMAAEREFGDPTVFDNQLVSMSHPDAMNALSSGAEIAAHFTSLPYLLQEEELPGARVVLTGEEAFGGRFTFIVGVVTDDYAEREPEAVAAVQAAIVTASRVLAEDPDARSALASAYQIDSSLVETILDRPDLVFDTEVYGVDRFQEFMVRAGYLGGARNQP